MHVFNETLFDAAFAMLFMVRYDNVQRLMQAELDQVCGDCFPSLAHRSRYATVNYLKRAIFGVNLLGCLIRKRF